MQNYEGKKFEEDFAASCPDNCWIYRLRDNAAAFNQSSETRFTTTNIADYILWDDITRSMYICELKTTKNSSIPFINIRESQVKGLTEAGAHKVIPCFLFNYRAKGNATYFMYIHDYLKMVETLGKQSFNPLDIQLNGGIPLKFTRKKTRYTYDIADMIDKTYKQCVPPTP